MDDLGVPFREWLGMGIDMVKIYGIILVFTPTTAGMGFMDVKWCEWLPNIAL